MYMIEIHIADLPSKQYWNCLTFVSDRRRTKSESIAIGFEAAIASGLLLASFLILLGKSPKQFIAVIWLGRFGSSVSLQNTLQCEAPGDLSLANRRTT